MPIKRIWHGWTTPENAVTYRKLLHDEVFPEIEAKDLPGYSSIELFRRDLDGEVEFVTMMTFRSLQNVIDFQGEDYQRCYVADAAQAVLERWDRTASHYEALEIRDYDPAVRDARGGSRARFDHDRRSERAAAEAAAKSDPFADEIRALHRFLDAWLKGRVERGDGEPARLVDVLADDFVVIHPNGIRGDKAAAVGGFARAYGEKPPDYALEIGRIDTRMLGPDLCLAIYEERHSGEPGRARIASAVLRQRSGGGIEWLQLQETLAPHLDDGSAVPG